MKKTVKTQSGGRRRGRTGATKGLHPAEKMLLCRCNPAVWISYIQETGKGRWIEAEHRLLERRSLYGETGGILQYATEVIGGRWREYENCLIEETLAASDDEDDLEDIVEYAERVIKGRWREVEDFILVDVLGNSGLPYAQNVIKGRWPAYENMLLKGRWDDCVIYSAEVIRGRWQELEDRLAGAGDTLTPGTLWEYASRVVNSRLPEELHNRMLAFAITSHNDPDIKRYFSTKKYQKVRKPR